MTKKTTKKSKRKTAAKATKTNMLPPKGVRTALKRGLDLCEDYGGKGLRDHTIREAQELSEGHPVSEAKVRKMRAWFARHEVDKKPGWSRPPTPGYVAWLLWGGDAGHRWSRSVVEKLDRTKA